MPQLFLVLIAKCFVLLMCFVGIQQIYAQTDKDKMPRDLSIETDKMPRLQKEIIDKCVEFSKQYKEARVVKNAVAREDALKAHKQAVKAWLEDINNIIAKEGLKEWVGNATVSSSTVTLDCKIRFTASSPVHNIITISFPVALLPQEVRNSISKLGQKELVKYSIASTPKVPIVFETTFTGGVSARVKSTNVTELKSLGK